MKKYTVVYGIFYQVGSHTQSVTAYMHIECNPEHLKEEVESLISWTNVWFVFDGHCVVTND